MRRLETCGDLWYMMGCTAEAEVSYPLNDYGDRRIETFTSGGLWGIESDISYDDKRDIANDQLWDLIEHVRHFGIEAKLKPGTINEVLDRMDNTEHRRDSPRSQWLAIIGSDILPPD